ncbi:Iron(3+)-hydroxamate import ATP-binding protein FhuC [uncultured Roseburia sp.]|uniref:ABC transporter ATP-binding protein n=1 Tax=Brotonthovivens ammoniilytica TaxID=2981725 RepID=A0ABT2TNL6_9FIRM|nr:ABC transporter ATP-binding protein [Brotonthovivens ammoniilytica]MCU6763291.1 ABC transporter ATP-binding protein [Brotonthovivens ammoniilytica]SCJ12231.1 Iron(3+)-hydroxamate import ATP-binding protein FhuC [uncultured Roseburia sp.]
MSVRVIDLSFSYGSREILHNISFQIKKRNLVCLLGPNGVGKSTLFRNILGILSGYKGTILVNEQNTEGLSIEQMAKLIAYIPQSHETTFNFSVFDMVLMGTTSQTSLISIPGKKQRELVEAALERLGIGHLKNRGFAQISGGERQLTLIARALVQQTKVLIMDEPTANLDYGNQIRVLEQVKSLTEDGYTIIQATHQPDQAFLFADEVLALKDGKILAQGSPKEIITTDFINTLYDVTVDVQSLYDDQMRVCVPVTALRKR